MQKIREITGKKIDKRVRFDRFDGQYDTKLNQSFLTFFKRSSRLAQTHIWNCTYFPMLEHFVFSVFLSSQLSLGLENDWKKGLAWKSVKIFPFAV